MIKIKAIYLPNYEIELYQVGDKYQVISLCDTTVYSSLLDFKTAMIVFDEILLQLEGQ